MTRYFEQYFNGDSMEEIDETVAVASGSYLVEDGGPMRRYRLFIAGKLAVAIYAGWSDPSAPLADLQRRNERVEAEIYSPVERVSNGGRRWRTWYVDANGQIKKVLEPEYDGDGRRVKESLRRSDGELVGYTVYRYDKNGYLLELVTYDSHGVETGRQDA